MGRKAVVVSKENGYVFSPRIYIEEAWDLVGSFNRPYEGRYEISFAHIPHLREVPLKYLKGSPVAFRVGDNIFVTDPDDSDMLLGIRGHTFEEEELERIADVVKRAVKRLSRFSVPDGLYGIDVMWREAPPLHIAYKVLNDDNQNVKVLVVRGPELVFEDEARRWYCTGRVISESQSILYEGQILFLAELKQIIERLQKMKPVHDDWTKARYTKRVL